MAQTSDATQGAAWIDRMPRIAAIRVAYVRVLSFLFLGLGLFQWAVLLGALPTSRPDFFTLSLQAQAMILFFAVANLVTSVGLWMTATWGIVVWFSAASARIIRHTVFAASLGWMPIATSAEVVLIIGYLVLLFAEARAERREASRQRDSRRRAID